MYENDQNKSNRVLFIYSELLNGKVLKKKVLITKFFVFQKKPQLHKNDEKTIHCNAADAWHDGQRYSR